MILKFNEIEPGQVLETDLCIVGTGASGITLATEFAHTSTNVIVIESGMFDVDDAFEELNDGEVIGMAFRGLREGRRRGLGGTTAAWGGQCCELDESDFELREWIPDSGWPFGRSELEPFYRRAERVFNVQDETYDEAIWRRFRIEPTYFDRALLRTSFSVFSPKPRIGKVYRDLMSRARNMRVILGATTTNIQTTANAARATCIDVRDFSGRHAQVSARTFVLCTGTIETARLLLASRDVIAQGLGNSRDLVGRYFQDHPTSYTATIVADDVRRIQDLYGVLYRGKTWYWPKISLSPDLQRKDGLLNGAACAMFIYDSPAIEILREMVRVTRTGGRFRYSPAQIRTLLGGAAEVVDAGFRRYVLGRSPRAVPTRIDLMCTIEQAPRAESRIVLAEARDRLGMPRAQVDWKIGDRELITFRALTDAVDKEFRRVGLGVVIAHPWLAEHDVSKWQFWDNFHQLGTTRMSLDAAKGVVDQDCRVHGIEGLYVAGSPTFPASGYANPVLTTAALTIRLADHLKKRHRETVGVSANTETVVTAELAVSASVLESRSEEPKGGAVRRP